MAEGAKAVEPEKVQRIFFIKRAAEEVVADAEPEDRFAALSASKAGPSIIEPPSSPRDLKILAERNSILHPLIQAYVTNIDGTGASIVRADGEEPTDEQEVERGDIQDFFDEIWPGASFQSVRKELRWDREGTGNAYLEVIRSLSGVVRGARHVDAVDVRFVRLDDPITVEVPVIRGGEEIMLRFSNAERRFVRAVGNSFVYFKEFGATRDLDKETGAWATDDMPIPVERRATELIHFGTGIKHVDSPYHLPRWYSNIPSVTGARKAEEFNGELFDSGGVPPLMIIISGGQLAENAERALRDHFMSSGPARNQAVILEAFAATGDVDSPQNVRVQVEKFGSEQQNDSMFEEYIASADMRVRRAFRLPPIFLGNAEDFSFATAHASYTVAEAQVFAPERDDFDEVINLRLMPEIPGAEEWRYRSTPLTVRDVSQQLEAMVIGKDLADKEAFLKELNEAVNINLTPRDDIDEDDDDEDDDAMAPGALRVVPGGQDQSAPTDAPAPGTRVARSDTTGIAEAAAEAARLMNDGDEGLARVLDVVRSMSEPDQRRFRAVLAMEFFPEMVADPAGAQELANACFVMQALAEQR